ncbi:hypothetical protein PaeCFBP13512_19050 [Paenibacillus sp. CFBP13512]|uniref:calcium-binding protein n=1 Tax=Paenibacillus sp. CFBP13512 TaxID=2184007 RepID=UPI0010BF8B21|nr:calcium-binding protein [Paenibacillus sp. CFBP13512]TKJ87052.1 hypothetical protein PaeCFBP13512_19050 [Paenibacillus sp. CFBP13512]
MASDLEYLKLAQNCYEDEVPAVVIITKNFESEDNTRGWIALKQKAIGKGFFSRAYVNTKSKEVIFAFRGSNSLSDWSLENTDLSWNTTQAKAAKEWVKEVIKQMPADYLGYKYNFAGHSLGGKIAQQTLVSAIEGDISENGKSVIPLNQIGKAVVFNSAGAWNADGERPMFSRAREDYPVFHYSTSGDVLNGKDASLGIHFGKHTVLPHSYTKGEKYSTQSIVGPVFIHNNFNSFGHYMNKSGIFSNDEVYGYDNNNDVLNGRNTSEMIIGYDGDDIIYGNDGDDRIQGNDGSDTVYGGNGNDEITGAADDDFLNGEIGVDVLSGGSGNDQMSGGEGDDVLDGGTGADILEGGLGNDTYIFHKGDGFDTIVEYGRNFNDTLKIYGYTIKEARFKFFVTPISSSGKYGLKGINIMIYFPKKHGNTYKNIDKITIKSWELSNGQDRHVERLLFINNGEIESYDFTNIASNTFKKPFKTTIITGSKAAIMDPLVLDLNGDGISTSSVDEGIYFDYDGDGFSEKTGWVNNEDGLLVRDLNGDGQINNGTELFGERTRLRNGNQATTGFEALIDLDTNSDGNINQQDAAFNELKIWKDIDSDGVVDEGELSSLTESGITSLSLDYGEAIGDEKDAGNKELRTSNYTLSNNTSQPKLAEFQFDLDLSDTIPVSLLNETEEIEMLPDIAGIGNVHSLHQAILKDSSLHLQDWVQDFITNDDISAREQLIQKIIYKWTEVENIDPTSRGQGIDAQKLIALERFYGINSKGNISSTANAAVIEENYKEITEHIYAQLMAKSHLSNLYNQIDFSWDNTTGALQADLQMVQDQLDASSQLVTLGEFIRTVKNLYKPGSIGLDKFVDYFSHKSIEEALIVESNYRKVMNGTDKNDNLNGTDKDETLLGGSGDDILDGQAGNNALFGGAGNDIYLVHKGSNSNKIYENDNATVNIDIVQINNMISPDQVSLTKQENDLIIQIKGETGSTSIVNYFKNNTNTIEKIVFGNGKVWDTAYVASLFNTAILGTESDDTLYGTDNGDEIKGFAGDDTLNGGIGNDWLDGGAGNDFLYGSAGNDTLIGGKGNDTLGAGSGQNTIDGGNGNDVIILESSSHNTIRFGYGYGTDYIWFSENTENIIEFSDEITISDVKLINDDNLVISLNSNDKLIISNYFAKDKQFNYSLKFHDGSIWNSSDITNRAYKEVPYSNTKFFEGSNENDQLNGTDNNDLLYGNEGDDWILGKAGDDRLIGGAGNDILDGGIGNDILYGNSNDLSDNSKRYNGADTYIFGRGYGEDTIYDYDGSDYTDTLKLMLNPDEVEILKQFGDLVFRIKDTKEQISVQNYFIESNNYQGSIEKVVFLDGTVWNQTNLKNHLIQEGSNSGDYLIGVTGSQNYLYGYSNDDILLGDNKDDHLYGGSGNDRLYGKAGNDTLDGGSGNDKIYGDYTDEGLGSGEDTYVFGRGYGQDQIYDYDATSFVDTIKMLVNSSEAEVLKSYDDLILRIKDTEDQISIPEYFSSSKIGNTVYQNTIERVTFVDGIIWNRESLMKHLNVFGDSENNSLQGGIQAQNYIYGYNGNDILKGQEKNDELSGGSGDDTLYGYAGDDVLDGGSGNDKLFGNGSLKEGNEGGADTYVFGRGYGQDIIYDYDNVRYMDTLKLLVDPEDIEIIQQKGDLIFRILDTGDQISLSGYFYPYTFEGVYYQNAVEKITFIDGTIWNQEDLLSQVITTWGTYMDDTISGVDQINNTIRGLNGNDLLSGKKGNDTLFGNSGNDILLGEDGNDQMYGGADNDFLYGGSGNDILDGGSGNDNLYGNLEGLGAYDSKYAGSDTYVFGRGYGKDIIFDNDADIDTIQMLVNPEDIEVLDSMNGIALRIKNTNDQIEIGNYFSLDSSQRNIIERVIFIDGTVWDQNEIERQVIILGTSENDELYGYAGDDKIYGQQGNDSLIGNSGADKLYGGADNDSLYGGLGDDILDGGSGNDTLIGGNGNDTYIFARGYGKDVISESDDDPAKTDTIKLSVNPADIELTRETDNLIIHIKDTEDILHISSYFTKDKYSHKIERIVFANGTIWNQNQIESAVNYDVLLFGGNANDKIDGGIGNDYLYGGNGNDRLSGNSGKDNLSGESGDDILEGGADDDILDGGIGNDYLYGGSGNDTYIFARGYGNDTIFESGDSTGKIDTVKLFVNPSDIEVSRNSNDLVITIKDTKDILRIDSYFIEDQYSHKIDQIIFADGTIWNQSQIEFPPKNDDVLQGTEGNDVLDGGLGNDQLYGGSGDDILAGENGSDWLDGGAGTDQLYGGSGSDTYIFGRGYGQDLIFENDKQLGDIDTLKILANASDIEVFQKYGDLIIQIKDTADQINIRSYFEQNEQGVYIHKIERIIFEDGTNWDQSKLEEHVVTRGTQDDDYLYGIEGFNDHIYGLSGNDQLFGNSGDDILDGGAGDDRLYGDQGSDTYIFGKGYGHDVIVEGNSQPADIDTINMLVNPDEIEVFQKEYDLILKIKGTDDQLSIGWYFGQNWDGTYQGKIEKVVFADGTVWNQKQLEEKSIIQGTNDADTLRAINDLNNQMFGLEGADGLYGSIGNDALYGGHGNDLLDGGVGNDRLYGGDGDDTYIFARGYGQDTIFESDSSTNKLNIIKLSLQTTDIDLIRESNDLIIQIKDTFDTLRIDSYFKETDNTLYKHPIDQIVFEDGTVWDWNQIQELIKIDDVLVGGDGDDILNGKAGADQFYGGNGNDTLIGGLDHDILYGQNGADILDGGSGDDEIYGGQGSDTYIFGKGYGQDFIYDGSNQSDDIDTVQLLINPSELEILQDNGSLILKIKGTNDQLTIGSYFYQNDQWIYQNKIERLTFADGTVWDQVKLEENITTQGTSEADILYGRGDLNNWIYGFGGNDQLYGNVGQDILDGGVGSDQLYGGANKDTYVFGRGYGQDLLFESNSDGKAVDTLQLLVKPEEIEVLYDNGSLTVHIKDSSDWIKVGSYFNSDANGQYLHKIEKVNFSDGTVWNQAQLEQKVITRGSDNDDYLYARSGLDNNIEGMAGNDYIYGSLNSDRLDGGAGNDQLYGNRGSDTYVFGRGYGQDLIYDGNSLAEDIDTIRILADPDEIEVLQDNGSLVFRFKDATDQIKVGSYFDQDTEGKYAYQIEQVVFENGIIWDKQKIEEHVITRGTNLGEILYGRNELNDYMYGLEGNDQLFGNAGNDRIDGGLGDDQLYGGSGNDTYIFSYNSGHDTIFESDSITGNKDIVELDVNYSDIFLASQSDNLQLELYKSEDRLTISGWDTIEALQVEEFVSKDGYVLRNTQVSQLIDAMASFSKESGMSWSQAIDEKQPQALNILAQYWSPNKNN